MNVKTFWMSQDRRKSNLLKIKELRQEATSLIIINNAIVAQIWDIDQELLSMSFENQTELLRQKEQLTQELITKEYLSRIDALKKEINDLEVKEFGKSDILCNSPKLSNNLL